MDLSVDSDFESAPVVIDLTLDSPSPVSDHTVPIDSPPPYRSPSPVSDRRERSLDAQEYYLSVRCICDLEPSRDNHLAVECAKQRLDIIRDLYCNGILTSIIEHCDFLTSLPNPSASVALFVEAQLRFLFLVDY